ncbi:MAG: phytanoyl-CoA dioxygenase family protein [Planctomycetota bacterium]
MFDHASYDEKGYAILPDLYDAEAVAALCTQLSELAAEGESSRVGLEYERSSAERGELQIRKYHDTIAAGGPLAAWMLRPPVPAILEACLGEGPRLLQSMALVKPPHIGIAKDWHRDTPYFQKTIDQVRPCVGLWLALDEATTDNGCMQVLPGSHRWGELRHVQGPTGWMLDPDLVREHGVAAEALPMTAGSLLVFDGDLLHYTAPNRSSHRRRALQNHAVPGSVRWIGGETRHPPLPLIETVSA